MRYFIAFYIFTIYLFGYSYQLERYNYSNSITLDKSEEYVIIENSLEENRSEGFNEEISTLIKYIPLIKAREEAMVEDKFLLVKIESNNCPTCSELNVLLDTNKNIKNMVNEYTKAVKFNRDYDKIPPKLQYIGTPTLFLLDSKGKRVLMRLQGTEAIEDIEESLKLFIYDNS